MFSTHQDNGETALQITGKIYGSLMSIDSFQNYYLQTKVRSEEKKWAPRLTDPRNSGILYHRYGEHGAFWNVWKRSLEFQLQESNKGDLITLAGPRRLAPYRLDGKYNCYATIQPYADWSGYLFAPKNPTRRIDNGTRWTSTR